MKYVYLFLTIMMIACEKDPILPVFISIKDIKSSIDYTTSVIQFSITGNANKAGVMYGIEKELSNTQIQYAEKANGEISVQLNGLEQGKEYFYKVFVEDKKGNQMFGEIKNFITLSPSVKTGDATEITTETATLSLSFKGSNLSEVGILYSTDELCKDNLQTVSNTSPSGNNFSFEVKELNPGTTYYYKAYVKYKNGTIHYGEIKSFQTDDFEIPISFIEADFDGGVFNFELNAPNIEWEISTEQYWITVNPNKGISKSTINVHIAPVEIPYERKGFIIIKNTNSNVTKIISVVQASKENISNKLNLSIPGDFVWEEGGTNFFVVNSDVYWTASSNQDWCKINTPSGKNQQIVSYTVDPLDDIEKQRVAIITIHSTDGVQYFSVGQESTNASVFMSGGAIDVCNSICYNMHGRIKAPGEWTVSSTEEWYQFEKQSGVGEEEVEAYIQINDTYQNRATTNILKSGNKIFKNHVIQRGKRDITSKELPDIEMIFVQGGSFMMGNSQNESSSPIHKVTLSDFYIGKYEVTQDLWEAVMGNNPSHYIGENLPVNSIAYNQALEFIDKLNQLTGKKYRLPTEAEWEYAAKGGNKSKGYIYSGSDSYNDVCNLAWKASVAFVGSKEPNELGIYDMTGNVSEFCSDWYGPYSSLEEYYPTGPVSGDKIVVRGEYYFHTTTSDRFWGYPGVYGNSNGFRLVLDK